MKWLSPFIFQIMGFISRIEYFGISLLRGSRKSGAEKYFGAKTLAGMLAKSGRIFIKREY